MSIYQDRMAELRQRFAASAAAQVELLAGMLGTGDTEGIRALAHGLSGRAGMFGFGELGNLARAVDEADAADIPIRAQQLLQALRLLAQEED